MLSLYEELRETSRRAILSELRGGSRSVNDLVRTTGLRQSNVSNHLARMRLKGLVRHSKVGRHVYYSLASAEVETAVNALLAIKTGCCEGKPVCPLVERFALAAVKGDETAASEILDEAFRFNAGLVEIYQDLLAPSMYKVGAWYQSGEINSAQEHMASEVTLRAMSRVVQMTCPSRPNGRSCVLGSAPHGWHVLGLRMAADLLRVSGWNVLYLGANVPMPCFLKVVRDTKPDLVLTSCCDSGSRESTLDLLGQLVTARGSDSFAIGIGGRIVASEPEPFRAAGADLVITSLRQFACEILPSV